MSLLDPSSWQSHELADVFDILSSDTTTIASRSCDNKARGNAVRRDLL